LMIAVNTQITNLVPIISVVIPGDPDEQ
jgi:hypothetical protein